MSEQLQALPHYSRGVRGHGGSALIRLAQKVDQAHAVVVQFKCAHTPPLKMLYLPWAHAHPTEGELQVVRDGSTYANCCPVRPSPTRTARIHR